jgi:hypothetical protein
LNGKFFVTGDFSMGAYSTDGISWTFLPSREAINLQSGMRMQTILAIAYGNGVFVAVAERQRWILRIRRMALIWTALHCRGGYRHKIWICTIPCLTLRTATGRFVAVGDYGMASYSTDGITWTALTPGTETGIKFGSTNVRIALRTGMVSLLRSAIPVRPLTPTDGITWTALTPGT